MSLVANGMIVWMAAVWPWAKTKLAEIKAGLGRRKALAAGGVAITLALNVVAGKMPTSKTISLHAVVPGIPAGPAPAELAGTYTVAPLDMTVDGKTPENASLIAQIQSGRQLLLLKKNSKDGRQALMSTEGIGGPTNALNILEAQAVAKILGQDQSARRILTQPEVRALNALSRALDAPVYELDLGAEPSQVHPTLGHYIFTDRGEAFFADLGLLAKLAASPQRLAETTGYLSSLRQALKDGRSPAQAEREFMRDNPAFSQWAQKAR